MAKRTLGAVGVVVALIVVVTLVRFRSDGDAPSTETRPNAAGAELAPPPVSSTPAPDNRGRPIGPTDPLPAPAASAGSEEERAAGLAAQVLAGGEAARPALVAAVQLAGFPIRGADGTVTQPPGQSQGIVFDLWEVNALAELARTRRDVTAPLDAVASALASPLAELASAPMASLLIAGVRQHANDKDGSLLFWATFIAELGRQARTYAPYDLLGDVDPARTQLGSIQLTFLAKRLAGEAAAIANPDQVKKKTVAFQLPPILPAVYAQAPPCNFKDAPGEIVDWTAFGVTTAFGALMEYLDAHGVGTAASAARMAGYANIVLAYAKIVLAMAAFEIDFTLEEGTPLVRTQERRPRAGETKTLRVTAMLNLDKIAWVNCFRLALNHAGVDFSVDTSGPMDDASVSFTAASGFSDVAVYSGGPEQLVRYVDDPANRIQTGAGVGPRHTIVDQLTNSKGEARVRIEGVGQRESLGSQPRPIMKEATAGAQVAMKPARLYRDLKDAFTTATGGLGGLLTMPVELLYRSRFAFGGWYTFPIQDWKAGNGWSGTLTYVRSERSARSSRSESTCASGRQVFYESSAERQETAGYQWEISDDSDSQMLTPGFSVATALHTVSGGISVLEKSFHTGCGSCRGHVSVITSTGNERTETGAVSYSTNAQVTVDIDETGLFVIDGGSGEREDKGPLQITEKNDRNNGCDGAQPTRTDTMTGTYRVAGLGARVEGKADPGTDRLSGSLIRVEKFPETNTVITHRYRWDLRR